jgi:hypothetical protein
MNGGIRVNIPDDLRARLEAAQRASVHKLSISQIVERGIVLALDELDAISAALAQRKATGAGESPEPT